MKYGIYTMKKEKSLENIFEEQRCRKMDFTSLFMYGLRTAQGNILRPTDEVEQIQWMNRIEIEKLRQENKLVYSFKDLSYFFDEIEP